MATGRQRSERKLAVAQAMLAAMVFFDKTSEFALYEFIRCGQFEDENRIPYNPDIARKIEEIRANGGKLIVEPARPNHAPQ